MLFEFCKTLNCVVYPMLPVSLNCPYLIAPSVFSNFYSICRIVLSVTVER